MNWLKENWFKIGLLIIMLSILGMLLLDYKSKDGITSEYTPQVESIDFSQPLEKNIEVENLYYSLKDLPPHHTVCIPVKKYVCDITGCEETVPAVFNLIGGDNNNSTLSRCDRNPCGTYPAKIDTLGTYKYIQPGPGILFIMEHNTTEKRYVEIVTLGVGAFTTYGYCKNALN